VSSVERLTDRERQILDLAAQHLTSKQIGPLLGIRPASVDTFMQAIIRKLGVAGRKEAVIAYLAAVREPGQGRRDDLDFGSSSVFAPSGPPSGGGVGWDGEDVSRTRRLGLRVWRGVRSRVTSPARRLVAIAIAAMVLGLVTLGAVVMGYGLIRTFDRMFADHGLQLHGRSGRHQDMSDAELDRRPRRHAVVFD
jgi:DNA-binding CsgD family transcriptional regulator